MAKNRYELSDGEYIILKAYNVSYGNRGLLTDELILTNQNIGLVKYGLFNNFKGVVRFPLDNIVVSGGKPQVIIGRNEDGEKHLEVYFKDGMEKFCFGYGNYKTLRIWAMAITDRFSDLKDSFDHDYYQQFDDSNFYNKFFQENNEIDERFLQSQKLPISDSISSNDMINALASTNILPKNISKSLKKAQKQSKKNSLLNGLVNSLGLNEMIDEFKDDITDIRNDFREEVGMKPLITKRALKEQQAIIKEQEKNKEFQKHVDKARQEAADKQNKKTCKLSFTIDEQIILLKKLKELVDSGIITQEEFEKKKKEILG